MTVLARLAGDVPVIGPVAIAITNLTTVSSQVLASDAVRHGVIFHNPSATVAKRVAPANMALAGGSGGIEIAPQSTFMLLDQGDDERFNVNTAWIAVTDNNADATLTIWNFTDQSSAKPAPLADMNVDVQITSPLGTQISTLGTASAQIIGQNIVRRGILLHNPDTVLIAVSPSNLAAVIGAGSIVILPGQELRIPAKGRVRVNCAFNAIAASGANHSLTVLEFL